MTCEPGPPEVPEDFVPWLTQGGGEEIYRMACFCTRDPKLGEEIAQDAVIKIYKAWPDKEKRDYIRTVPACRWTIVKNCYRDYLRARNRAGKREVELDAERHGRTDTGVDHDIRLAILSLEDDEREMITLVYYERLTIAEAGTQLGLSAPQAYRLHSKARARLARQLEERKG
jgi:RNA polymerase sigma factor (sigma-70 family)